MRVAILGSCVTRDAVAHFPSGLDLVLYAARTSFLSLTAPPVDVDESAINIASAFARRIVYWDLSKSFWSELERAKPDAVIIDLIDERFNLLKRGDRIVVRSPYLVPVEKTLLPGYALMRRNDERTHAQWRRACSDGVVRLKEICSEIVVHRAMWAETCLVGSDVRPFEDDKRNAAVSTNAWLGRYYDHLVRACGDAKLVAVPEEFCVADPNHKWGHDHFHYIDRYYEKVGEILAETI